MHPVHFHSTDGDGELAGDLFILHPTADKRDDFVLPRSKSRQVAAVEESNDLIRNRIFDPDVAATYCSKTFDDRGHRKCLFQDATHAALERAKGLDFGNGSDPENGMAVKRAHPNLRYYLESRLIARRLIEQDDIRLDGRDRFQSVGYRETCPD